jgi:hypothetical protein
MLLELLLLLRCGDDDDDDDVNVECDVHKPCGEDTTDDDVGLGVGKNLIFSFFWCCSVKSADTPLQ